jgi:hypothetical protein
MSTYNYRIKIIRTGQEFEVEGDKDFVLQMLKYFETNTPIGEQSGKKPIKTLSPTIPKTKPVSVGEFIRQLEFKKHTDIVLAFGYYLENYSELKEFVPADINTCYYDAKMEASNTSQMIIQNIKRGYMMQSRKGAKGTKSDKRYLITQSGIDFIANKLKK